MEEEEKEYDYSLSVHLYNEMALLQRHLGTMGRLGFFDCFGRNNIYPAREAAKALLETLEMFLDETSKYEQD